MSHKPKWETQPQVGGGWLQDAGRNLKNGLKGTAGVVGAVASAVPAVLKAKKYLGYGHKKRGGRRNNGRKTTPQYGGWGFNVGPLGVNF